jgi:hypothetical protein
MKYMLLLYETEGAYEGEAGQKTLAEIIAKHMKLAEELVAAGVEFSGHELQPTGAARTVRPDAAGAKTIHDGPFAETREQLGGYYVIDVADFEAATAWARKVPVIPGGKVEVRPVGAH